MARKAKSPLQARLDKLEQALRRLDPEQGIVARRRARHATLAALREFRRVLDREYPVIQKKRKPRRKSVRVRPGYVLLSAVAHGDLYSRWITAFAEAAIPIQRISKGSVKAAPGLYVPEWAVAICSKPLPVRRVVPLLKRAKKERSYREVELAAYKLKTERTER